MAEEFLPCLVLLALTNHSFKSQLLTTMFKPPLVLFSVYCRKNVSAVPYFAAPFQDQGIFLQAQRLSEADTIPKKLVW